MESQPQPQLLKDVASNSVLHLIDKAVERWGCEPTMESAGTAYTFETLLFEVLANDAGDSPLGIIETIAQLMRQRKIKVVRGD